jgi:hypothetical protein
MRGTYYPAKVVEVPLDGKGADALKKAMEQGVAELNQSA